ncbi:MAG: dTDP-4-dehydrorhamnose 3,5-epimerase family protein [candidate division WOR-3 bacterium]
MSFPFTELAIKGVFILRASAYTDHRGWLIETFRQDWLFALGLTQLQPAMSYISMTYPNTARGPHEHRLQTDWLAFLGPSDFQVFLWDNRSASPTFKNHLQLTLGENNPSVLIVPNGVVHGYKNIGEKPGLVLNYPNRLYRGWNRSEPVDEIRYEDDPNSPFRID